MSRIMVVRLKCDVLQTFSCIIQWNLLENHQLFRKFYQLTFYEV